jgi:hypothetical protein
MPSRASRQMRLVSGGGSPNPVHRLFRLRETRSAPLDGNRESGLCDLGSWQRQATGPQAKLRYAAAQAQRVYLMRANPVFPSVQLGVARI